MDFPLQVSSTRPSGAKHVSLHPQAAPGSAFDLRDFLTPQRLTILLWDQAFVLRHGQGGSFQDWDRVLDETVERGYNTLRLDPMPQWIDLSKPDNVLRWEDPKTPYLPWDWNTEVEAPAGRWMIDFMEKLLARPSLHYTLSAWWFCNQKNSKYRGPETIHTPRTHLEAAELWIKMLTDWKRLFGFDKLVFVDLANEVPYFLPGFLKRFAEETGGPDWGGSASFPPHQVAWLADELNKAIHLLQREFPELRFTASIHGDMRWIDVPVEFDCVDVHFYADADPRWAQRTRFPEWSKDFFYSDVNYPEFSDRCTKTARAIAPMLRQRQRAKLAAFAQWAQERGMPLLTTESWASWFYYDHPQLDWKWLLDWAEWSVDDALEFKMWGWTPHNYTQPQFANWNDVAWHQKLTSRFLKG